MIKTPVQFVHRVGTHLGPCNDCYHNDCHGQRTQARSICRFCRHQIGFDRSFRNDPDQFKFNEKRFVHASCLNEYEEKHPPKEETT